MNIEELREYNKLVIEASKEVAKPYKITTFILASLLAGMIALYFLCPSEIVLDQTFDGSNSFMTTNNQEG